MLYNKDKKRERKERKKKMKVYGLAVNYNRYTYYRNPKGEIVKKYEYAYSSEWRKNIDKKEEKKVEKN